MYSNIQLTIKYIRYFFTASNGMGHGIHSPFVFDFIKNVLNNSTAYEAYHKVESVRAQLLKDESVLHINDMGTGSAAGKDSTRTVSAILRHASKRKKLAQLLFRIAKHYSPQTIIELGTSAGLTTAYFALANEAARVITFEGAPEIAALARKNINLLQIQNISLVEGGFDGLENVLNGLAGIDLAFVDGNHGKLPTLRYFDQLLAKANPSSILIFDDIRWSKEMEEAWKNIKLHDKVTLSIDLFFLGIVFFREEFKVKQHFTIRY